MKTPNGRAEIEAMFGNPTNSDGTLNEAWEGANIRRVPPPPDQPHSKFRHVYPIVRIETPFDQTYPTNTLAVVKVLTSQTDAEVECSRLNQLNTEKGCVYLCCTSRLIE